MSLVQLRNAVLEGPLASLNSDSYSTSWSVLKDPCASYPTSKSTRRSLFSTDGCFYPQLQIPEAVMVCLPSFLTREFICRLVILKDLRVLKIYFTISVAVLPTFWGNKCFSLLASIYHINYTKEFQFYCFYNLQSSSVSLTKQNPRPVKC